MSKKTWGVFVAIVIILAIFGAWFYYNHSAQFSKANRSALNNAIPVETAKVQSEDLPTFINTVGTLRASQKATISFEIGGRLESLNFQDGAFVKKGQVLAKLDDKIYLANLKSAQAALALSKAKYERMQRLAATGAEAKELLDESKAQYLQDQAKVMSNQAYVNEATILAPFDGYVGSHQVSSGDYITAGQAITNIVDRINLIADYQVPEKYLNKIKLGQLVNVKYGHTLHHPISGKVTFIAPQVDEQTHTIEINAAINNKEDQLAPGLFVNIEQTVGALQHALVVPQAAVVPTIDGAMVYKLVKNRAVSAIVKVGPSIGGKTAILSGLESGDKVVISGQQQLKDGSLVREVS